MGSYKKELQSDLQALRDDVGKLADTLTGMLSDKGGDISDDVKDRIDAIREHIDEAMVQAADKGGKLVAAAQIKGVRESIKTSVREYPLTMLVVAAGLGVAVASQLRR